MPRKQIRMNTFKLLLVLSSFVAEDTSALMVRNGWISSSVATHVGCFSALSPSSLVTQKSSVTGDDFEGVDAIGYASGDFQSCTNLAKDFYQELRVRKKRQNLETFLSTAPTKEEEKFLRKGRRLSFSSGQKKQSTGLFSRTEEYGMIDSNVATLGNRDCALQQPTTMVSTGRRTKGSSVRSQSKPSLGGFIPPMLSGGVALLVLLATGTSLFLSTVVVACVTFLGSMLFDEKSGEFISSLFV